MSLQVRLIIFCVGLGLFALVFSLVRRGRFREELSVVWLLIGVTAMLSSGADVVLDRVAAKLGIGYPPVLGFVMLFLVLVVGFLYFSVVASDLKSSLKELAQHTALLEYELKRLSDKPPPP
jgi:hypothetical protein